MCYQRGIHVNVGGTYGDVICDQHHRVDGQVFDRLLEVLQHLVLGHLLNLALHLLGWLAPIVRVVTIPL